ncbi:Hypp6339 [Branchiostoma lanceolatum]|uniref:Hypp6339 protein n=1 Tax=Branchiostoma lanceolatum TaxID=7740 RepID=A0A8J9YT98_BRALA|nr:Hypp6339 [Branchiostoma lanceolatum]
MSAGSGYYDVEGEVKALALMSPTWAATSCRACDGTTPVCDDITARCDVRTHENLTEPTDQITPVTPVSSSASSPPSLVLVLVIYAAYVLYRRRHPKNPPLSIFGTEDGNGNYQIKLDDFDSEKALNS